MKKTAFISDVLFAFFGIALLTVCIFRFLKIPLAVCIPLGAVCGVLSACSVAAYLHNRRQKDFLKKSDEERKERLFTHLALLAPEAVNEFFRLLFAESLPKRRSRDTISDEDAVYCLQIRFAPLQADDIAPFIRLRTKKRKILVCAAVDATAEKLCRAADIEIFAEAEIYRLVKEKNAFPSEYLGSLKVPNDKRILRVCFRKSNAKRFLVSGGLLFASSLLTPFPYYYLVFGGILCAAALLIRIFGKA